MKKPRKGRITDADDMADDLAKWEKPTYVEVKKLKGQTEHLCPAMRSVLASARERLG